MFLEVKTVVFVALNVVIQPMNVVIWNIFRAVVITTFNSSAQVMTSVSLLCVFNFELYIFSGVYSWRLCWQLSYYFFTVFCGRTDTLIS